MYIYFFLFEYMNDRPPGCSIACTEPGPGGHPRYGPGDGLLGSPDALEEAEPLLLLRNRCRPEPAGGHDGAHAP